MTSYDQRQQKSQVLCEKLMERIGEVAAAVPLDHWPPIAGPPSVEFVVALSAWEIDPTDETMALVNDAYGRTIEAWRTAAAEFTTEGSQA